MKTIITESLTKSYTYSDYKSKVSDLLAENKSSGNLQNDEMVHYSKMNLQRMKRLDKTVVIVDKVKEIVEQNAYNLLFLVISEGWCGDAAQTLPVINKIVENSENIDLRIVFRDENEEIMNAFLTNGGKSIPKIIVLNTENYDVLADWGPRPENATKEVLKLKEQFGGITEEVKEGLQKWYNEDKGISAQIEISDLIKYAAI